MSKNDIAMPSTSILNSEVSDDDLDDKEEDISKNTKTFSPKQHLIEKFNLLKEKRLKLKKIHEKRLRKKQSKLLNPNSDNNHNKTEVESITEIPTSSAKCLPSVKFLEKKIDSALKNSKIEQAEELSDILYAKQTEESKKTKALDEFEHTQRKRLNWKFEAKQRWETKSNM